MFKKMLLGVGAIATVATLTLSGCNTFAGFGKDVERGGEKVQDTAEKAKSKM